MWRCANKRCRTWLSIRSGSFSEGSNIMLSSWLHLMFLWAIQISGSRIARLTSLSKPTVVRALGELRTICSNKVLNAGIKIGGLGKTVEIDESKFGAKRKYKRGRPHRAPIAQLIEHRVVMRKVVSSTPAGPTLRVLK